MKNEKYQAPLNIYISSSYDDAELAQKFLSDYVKGFGITVDKQRNGDELYVTIDGLDEDIDALVSVYTAQYDEFKKDCKAEPSGWVSPVNFEKSKEDESMKSESNIEDLRDQTISWGTMRSEDLIPKFLGVLKTYAKDKYDEYVNENPEVLDIAGLDDETLGWIVDELFDKLDEIAPEGTYFGAHPDDGADYGFWSVEESKQRESKKSEAYEDIWRGAKVVSFEDATDYIALPADEEQELINKYGEDYYDNPDAMDEYAEALDDYIVSMFDQDFVSIDGEEIPLGLCREPKVLIVQDIDHTGGDKAIELVKKLANGELTGSSDDGDYVAIMDGMNGSPHFDIYSEGGKSEGNDDDKGCKGKDCKDDKTKKNEADATFKVGDFVNYDAESDGKADLLNPMVYAEVSSVNDDGTLDLWVRDYDDGGKEVKGADTQFCDKLDHFAGMTDADHYYTGGRLNLYAGYYEIFITDKKLGKPYVFSGTIDDLGEKDAVDIYYDTISFVDKSLEDECRDWYWFDEDDPEGSKVIDMSDMVNPVESKKSEGLPFGKRFTDAAGHTIELSDWRIKEDDLGYFCGYDKGGKPIFDQDISKAVVFPFDQENYPNDEVSKEMDRLWKMGYTNTRKLQKATRVESKKSEGKDESKKNEKGTTKIETYDGFDELLGYADAEYLLEDVVDVLSKYYTYEDETFDEDQAKDDPEFTIKIEGGDERADFYSEDIFYVHLPNKEAAEELAKVLGGELNESKKSEDTYDRPVTLYASTRYDDAEEAQKFLDSISGGEVKVSKERNGDTLSVSIEGDDDAIDTFLAVYKDNYDTLEKDCDADVNGWTDPVDLKYYTVQGRKELTGESHKKSESLTLKQAELKKMAKYGEAEDITGLSDAEAKELKKSGVELVGISRGTYGMNGALMRGTADGKLYVITSRNSNLFYFV